MHYSWDGKNLYLDCHIQASAIDDTFGDVFNKRIKIRIAAAPTDGKANRHLIKFLSKKFKVPQKQISIVSGQSSRQKRVRIEDPSILPDFIKPA